MRLLVLLLLAAALHPRGRLGQNVTVVSEDSLRHKGHGSWSGTALVFMTDRVNVSHDLNRPSASLILTLR